MGPYLWFVPVGTVMVGVLLFPWLWTFWYSFQRWTPLRPVPPRFVGLDNYIATMTDGAFLTAFANTLVFSVVTVSIQFVLGLGLALLLNMPLAGRSVARILCLVPMLLTPSVVGLSWKVFFHEQFGIFNWLLSTVGLPPVGWLSDPDLTMVTIMIVQIWSHTAFAMLVLLAGLQGIPDEPIEAARVDGASSRQVFFHVTLPWLRPLIFITLLFQIIFAIRTFDIVYGLFRSGGPANAGLLLGVYLYDSLRTSWQIGSASSIAVILLVLTAAFGAWFAGTVYKTQED